MIAPRVKTSDERGLEFLADRSLLTHATGEWLQILADTDLNLGAVAHGF